MISARTLCSRSNTLRNNLLVSVPKWEPGMADRKQNAGEDWSKADLHFLSDAVARGMSLAEVAGFLGRTEDEIRAKITATQHRHSDF
jgi:hypothetical protein